MKISPRDSKLVFPSLNIQQACKPSYSFKPAKTFEKWRKQRNLDKTDRVFIISGNYPTVREALLSRGWIENPDEHSLFFDLKWTLKARISLGIREYQIVNHLERNYKLTTKANLVTSLQKLTSVDPQTFFPICFRAHKGLSEDFIENYRLNYAISVLKDCSLNINHHSI